MKRIVSLLICAVVVLFAVPVSAVADSSKTIRIGMTFSDLSNPVWAELVKEAQRYGKDKGVEVTYLDAKNSAAKQISQIENLVENKVDAIVVCSVDSSTLKDVTKRAMDAGVKIVAYTQHLDNYDAEYVLNAYDVGKLCGDAAAKFVNSNFKKGETVEWGLMDLPRYPEIIIRANGIKDAIAKGAPNAKLVATNSALTAADGIKNAEIFLQAHPNMKFIACIGGGGSVGANEGVKQLGKDGKTFAVFGIDATEQEITNIMAGDPEKSSVCLGGGKLHGRELIDLSLKAVNKQIVNKTVYMPQSLIDASNAQAYFKDNYAK